MTMPLQAGRFDRGHCAQRHGVVAGNDSADVSVGLEDGFRLLKCLGLRPVGGLDCHAIQRRMAIKDGVKSPGPHLRVGVGFAAQQFRIFAALRPDGPRKLLRHNMRTLVVVCDDLRLGDARRLGFRDRSGSTEFRRCVARRTAAMEDVRTGIVENNGRGIGCDGGIDQIVLAVGIIVMRVDAHAIAQALRARRPHLLPL